MYIPLNNGKCDDLQGNSSTACLYNVIFHTTVQQLT